MIFVAFFLAALAPAQTAGGWKLVWSDEFEKDGRPDPARWTYETGFVRNEELQWYRPENAWCEKGMLIIEGRREQWKNPAYEPGSANYKHAREFAEYTSASVTTRGIQSWRYGRFEMRARIDT
ncbi:MAG TPA: glycoside hydrolase family 16 protein, partial [bacterium]|nr:glycoside hydrolase family 16 protein [bacterium]